jgi:hypothetical protein
MMTGEGDTSTHTCKPSFRLRRVNARRAALCSRRNPRHRCCNRSALSAHLYCSGIERVGVARVVAAPCDDTPGRSSSPEYLMRTATAPWRLGIPNRPQFHRYFDATPEQQDEATPYFRRRLRGNVSTLSGSFSHCAAGTECVQTAAPVRGTSGVRLVCTCDVDRAAVSLVACQARLQADCRDRAHMTSFRYARRSHATCEQGGEST